MFAHDFNVDQLLHPIDAAQPCGADLAFSAEVDQIAQARQHDDPTLDQGAWVATLKQADWPFVANRCAAMIAHRSKDMRLAVWLAEAQAHTRGLRGLGDGYAVLAGLCERYWDGMHPTADAGDYEQRIGNLFWLLTRTPALIGQMLPPQDSVLLADVQYCLDSLSALERVVDQRLGGNGPGFSAALEALRSLLQRAAPVAVTMSAAAPELAAAAATMYGPTNAHGLPQDRQQALAQLRSVADFFRRTEPHSPVAYLADKAASWGEMALHEWLRAVIKDPATIAGVEELLAAPTAAAGS